MIKFTLFCVLVCPIYMETAQAIPHPPGFVQKGSIRGGQAGEGFVIMDLRRSYSAKTKLDRMVFDIAGANVNAISKAGYYQLAVDKQNQKLSLDFYQIEASQLGPKQFQVLAGKSPLIKKARMLYDPILKNLTIELLFKQKIKARVFELPATAKGARLALDVRPI